MERPPEPPIGQAELGPSIGSLTAQISDLQHQLVTVLFLSSINLIANVLTILVAFLAVG